MNPVHTLLPSFFKTHFRIICLCLDLPNCLFSSGFPTKSLYTPLVFTIHAIWPGYPIFDSHSAFFTKIPVSTCLTLCASIKCPPLLFSGDGFGGEKKYVYNFFQVNMVSRCGSLKFIYICVVTWLVRLHVQLYDGYY